MALLGAKVKLPDRNIGPIVAKARREAIIRDFRSAPRSNRHTPALAANFRGCLGFAQPLMFGRMGRALLSPVVDRQYSRATNDRFLLGEPLKDAILRWLGCLGVPPYRARGSLTPTPGPSVHRCVRFGTPGGCLIPSMDRIPLHHACNGVAEFAQCSNMRIRDSRGDFRPLYCEGSAPWIRCFDNEIARGTLIRGTN